jgi:hypothetical protein
MFGLKKVEYSNKKIKQNRVLFLHNRPFRQAVFAYAFPRAESLFLNRF